MALTPGFMPLTGGDSVVLAGRLIEKLVMDVDATFDGLKEAYSRAKDIVEGPKANGNGTVGAVQSCPFLQSCGINSAKCKQAAQSDPAVAHILSRVKRMRAVAIVSRLDGAKDALDRYLLGSGDFSEIPAEHAEFVRIQAGADHKAKAKAAHIDNGAAARALAMELEKFPGWPDVQPQTVRFKTDYTGGKGAANYSKPDNFLEYNGSTIKSEYMWKCERNTDGSYNCAPESAKSWVVDNYDWEGEKSIVGSIAKKVTDTARGQQVIAANLWMHLIPSQSEMDQLRKAGCAKSFQRSSKSWPTDAFEMAHTVSFNSPADVTQAARERRTTLKKRSIWEQEFAEDFGELPSPRPAEEQLLGPTVRPPN